MKTRVCIVDDHSVFRRGLREIFAETPDLMVEGEAADGATAVEQLRAHSCDVVLLDIALPGTDGLELLKQIKNEWPGLPVLILSFYPEEDYGLRMLKAGAAGYLTKESPMEELVLAVRKIANGGKYIRSSLAETLVRDLDPMHAKPPHFQLSEREFQVFCLMGKGHSVKQISRQLQLSDKTISTYRQRILEKMKMDNNLQIVRYAVQNHIEFPEPANSQTVSPGAERESSRM